MTNPLKPDLRRRFVNALLRVSVTTTFAGRSSLLQDLPNVSLNRDQNMDRLDLNLIVNQFVELGRDRRTGVRPLIVIADNALEHLGEALRIAPTEIDVLHAAAHVYAMLEQPDRAVEYLLQAIEAGYPRAEIRVDPVFQTLREDPRLRSALEEGAR